jgi:opacity protein-like surface antigen
MEPFLGGGLQFVDRGGVFIELTASRFKKTGQRAFRANNQNFGLGIPLTATITPLEVAGGYRLRLPGSPRLVPYVGAGVGSYGYKETSEFSDASENVDTRHTGYLAVGGAEFRLHRWIGVSVDAQYTHVLGILGTGGISQDAGEKDLGGIAARVKVLIGR